MSVLPRSLRNLPRSWWLTTGAVAIVVGLLVTTSLNKTAAAAARYSSPQTVLVLAHDVAAGVTLSSADVREEQWPESFLSSSPAVHDISGAVTVVPMSAGELLTEAKVDTGGLSATASQLRSGERGVSIGNSASMPKLQTGDWVDVIATNGSPDASAEPAVTIATAARVIAVDEQSTTIAVSEEDASRVIYASTKNLASLMLTRP